MGQYKYLAKNIGLLTLANFSTKLLSFFLVPLYTNILSTADYGTYDLFNTTIGVLLPVLTFNIQESVLRYSMDEEWSRKAIISVSMRLFLASNLIVTLGLFANYIFGFSTIIRDYALFFFLMYFTQTLSGIMTAYIRGIDSIADLSVSSVVSSAVTIMCNILFLIKFKWGLLGYFLANIIGPLIQCFYILLHNEVLRELDLHKKFEAETKAMLDYSKHLIANSLAWWINNASDKYVVIWFCGLGENGIYSVASKIPSILNVFQSIFAQAWTLSAVKDFDSEDKNAFFANTYSAYNCVMTIICSAIIVSDKLLCSFLYAKDFYSAWKYVPWLTIAIVFGSLSGYIGGFFSAVKNSKIFARSTMIGAATNIILNIVLTPLMGSLGAAIATMICYCVTWIFRYHQAKKYIKLRVYLLRDAITYILLVIQSVVMILVDKTILLYEIESTLFVLIVFLYLKDVRSVAEKLILALRKRR